MNVNRNNNEQNRRNPRTDPIRAQENKIKAEVQSLIDKGIFTEDDDGVLTVDIGSYSIGMDSIKDEDKLILPKFNSNFRRDLRNRSNEDLHLLLARIRTHVLNLNQKFIDELTADHLADNGEEDEEFNKVRQAYKQYLTDYGMFIIMHNFYGDCKVITDYSLTAKDSFKVPREEERKGDDNDDKDLKTPANSSPTETQQQAPFRGAITQPNILRIKSLSELRDHRKAYEDAKKEKEAAKKKSGGGGGDGDGDGGDDDGYEEPEWVWEDLDVDFYNEYPVDESLKNYYTTFALISNLSFLSAACFIRTNHHYNFNSGKNAVQFALEMNSAGERNGYIHDLCYFIFQNFRQDDPSGSTFNIRFRKYIYRLLKAVNDETHLYVKRSEILKSKAKTVSFFQELNTGKDIFAELETTERDMYFSLLKDNSASWTNVIAAIDNPTVDANIKAFVTKYRSRLETDFNNKKKKLQAKTRLSNVFTEEVVEYINRLGARIPDAGDVQATEIMAALGVEDWGTVLSRFRYYYAMKDSDVWRDTDNINNLQMDEAVFDGILALGDLVKEVFPSLIEDWNIELGIGSEQVLNRFIIAPSTEAVGFLFMNHKKFIDDNNLGGLILSLPSYYAGDLMKDLVNALIYPFYHFQGGDYAVFIGSAESRRDLRAFSDKEVGIVYFCNQVRGGTYTDVKCTNKRPMNPKIMHLAEVFKEAQEAKFAEAEARIREEMEPVTFNIHATVQQTTNEAVEKAIVVPRTIIRGRR